VPFSYLEHIIPESLGGDETLPPGFVCDNCNKYFGQKVENEALSISILSFCRSFLCVETKKKRYSRFKGFRFEICGAEGYAPRVYFDQDKAKAVLNQGGGILIFPVEGMGALARLLIKMGLEFIALSGKLDILNSAYDKARIAARFPKPGMCWKMAETSVKPDDVSEYGEDEQGPYQKRTLYSYHLGGYEDGLIAFAFQYWVHYFVVPLTDGNFKGFIDAINKINPEAKDFRIQDVVLTT
jgi:hypothetical protein